MALIDFSIFHAQSVDQKIILAVYSCARISMEPLKENVASVIEDARKTTSLNRFLEYRFNILQGCRPPRSAKLVSNTGILKTEMLDTLISTNPPKLVSKNRSIVYFFFGFVTILILIQAAYQLGWGYLTGQGLDVNLADYMLEAPLFLLIAFHATYQLQGLLAWRGLKRRAKQQIIVAEYEFNEISPAEAGVMLDTFSGESEYIAMLRSLEYKGWITVDIRSTEATIIYRGSGAVLSSEESLLAKALFSRVNILRLPMDRVVLQRAFVKVKTSIAESLTSQGFLPVSKPMSTAYKLIDYVLRSVAILFQSVLLINLFQKESWHINYPRYPVQLWQLIYIVVLAIVVVCLPLRSYLHERYSPRGWEVYRKVAGYYLYLEVALLQQLRTKTLPSKELEKINPYALAFGLINVHDDELSHFL